MTKSLLLALLLGAPSAFATLELRGTYGKFSKTPSSFNTQMEDYVQNAPDLEPPTSLGLDGIFRLPVLPVMIGLRLENVTFSKSGATSISGTATQTSTKLNASRSSLLVGWQLLGLPMSHLTVIGHYAFSQKLKYSMTSTNAVGAQSVESFSATMEPGYGVGIEGGVKIGYFVAAAEVGYTQMKSKEFTLNGYIPLDHQLNKIAMDLSGPYVRISAGVGY